LRPVGGAAAVVQIADINKGTYIQTYQSTMSLVVIDFTFLEGRDNEIVFKELAVADSHINRSRHVFKKPYGWKEVHMFNARINQAIGHGCKWNDGDVPYSELETATLRSIICCCNLLLWTSENKLY